MRNRKKKIQVKDKSELSEDELWRGIAIAGAGFVRQLLREGFEGIPKGIEINLRDFISAGFRPKTESRKAYEDDDMNENQNTKKPKVSIFDREDLEERLEALESKVTGETFSNKILYASLAFLIACLSMGCLFAVMALTVHFLS